MESPKITEVLGRHGIDIARCRFIKPNLKNGLRLLFEGGTTGLPDAGQLAVREITLEESHVIPFSKYGTYEKMIWLEVGEIQVFLMNHRGDIHCIPMKSGTTVTRIVIPLLHWHAVRAIAPCRYTAIISSQHDPDDLVWEDATEKLIWDSNPLAA